MNCDQLPESPERKRSKPSSEYSVISLDGLNYDCLEVIFQYISVKDLLQLRYLSRSLNNAVCQYLRTSVRKLQIFLNVDRNAEELEEVQNTLGKFYYSRGCMKSDSPNIEHLAEKVTTFDSTEDPSLLANQSHFRFENFVPFHSTRNSVEDKISSLVLFLTTHMTDLTKLALLIHHEHHFRSVTRLLAPLRKLKVLFIDVTYFVRVNSRPFPATQIVDVISNLPELDSLYYFPSNCACLVLYTRLSGLQLQKVSGSRENFFEVMLRRLRVVHAHYLTFPDGKTFDRIEELSISPCQTGPSLRNHFPTLRKLIFKPSLLYSPLPTQSYFENVTILVLSETLRIEDKIIPQLNCFRNLLELRCTKVWIWIVCRPRVTNGTVTRLYTRDYHLADGNLGNHRNWYDGRSDEEFKNFAAKCRKYFTALQMVKNEQEPAQIAEF